MKFGRTLTLDWSRLHDLVHDVLLGANTVSGAGTVQLGTWRVIYNNALVEITQCHINQ